ncbi:EcsC family protein [Paenibacillus sp.]|uniref:EcsC family protein n=1 Tax=Paenibacillus sp. TaxID=58172 RepID=UPI002811B1C9|nr:EcsC family protein [Paenibacillus sp.]
MNEYEQRIRFELDVWERRLTEPPGWLERTSKTISTKINELIPAKMHQAITATVRSIVRTALFGAEYTPRRKVHRTATLEEADHEARNTLSLYQKIATAEGAGTGAGGLLLNAVDFPALIAIKMKLLFELAHVYGYDTKSFSERIFLLNVFRLAFSSNAQREYVLDSIQRWDVEKERWSSDSEYYRRMDWETFQKEYRDSIDFRKMLQMVPGIGAVAGAWANYTILEELGEVAMNAYRMRRLSDASK